jgi:hypothetical protein
MTEKSRKTDFRRSKTAVAHSHVNLPRGRGRPKGSKNKIKKIEPFLEKVVTRGRGRPKGAKNKPKDLAPPPRMLVAKKRGRPKGAKNKSKLPDIQEVVVLHKNRKQNKPAPEKDKPEIQEYSNTQIDENHPLLAAVRWLEKYMHPVEMRYYRGRASKNSVSLHTAMMSDILGFFNVQNSEICKQIKKNKLVHIASNELH